ncbi:PREDICTED: uncharacterized protein LOC108383030, partial [Rhagoletis zephyria]|uniref:uncharacterized protein LOC108383030 n=1 Tax=Rhagoletis zephyria TaxID=28612 RepID=UPI00081189D8
FKRCGKLRNQNDMLLPDETYDGHGIQATVATVTQQPPPNRASTIKSHTDIIKSKSSKNKTKSLSTSRKCNDTHNGHAEAVSFKGSSSCGSNESKHSGNGDVSFPYSTTNFFTNILDALGDDILPQCEVFTHQHQPQSRASDAEAAQCHSLSVSISSSDSHSANGSDSGVRVRLTANPDVMRVVCDNFLRRHRIRPDFFCQYQQAISAAALLQQSKPKNANTATVACQPTVTVDTH